MGYACPVCEDPQSDVTHLANHLAFTAILRGGEHGEWLDEHVPGWGELDETALGEQVAEHAAETEFPQVFEDTTDRGPASHEHDEGSHRHATEEHGHAGGHAGHSGPGDLPAGADALAGKERDNATREAIVEAREMTRKRRENDNAAEADDEPDDGTGGAGGDGDDTGAGTRTEPGGETGTERE